MTTTNDPADAVRRAQDLFDRPELGNASHAYWLGTGDYLGEDRPPWTANNGGTGSDCWGLVAWAHRQPRHLEGYNPGGSVVDWINCDSAIEDAEGPARLWSLADRPEPGAIIVWPSLDLHGKRVRWGHVSIIESISRVAEWDPAMPSWALLDVIHICGPNGRKPAAVRASGALWAGRDRVSGAGVNQAWRSRLLRPVREVVAPSLCASGPGR